MSTPVPRDPFIGGLLRLAWQNVRERIYAGVVASGYAHLNPAHVGLFRTEGFEGRRPTEIADQMQVTKQSVNDLLRDLERMGYVELQPDPSDARARLVRLTPLGRKLERVVCARGRGRGEGDRRRARPAAIPGLPGDAGGSHRVACAGRGFLTKTRRPTPDRVALPDPAPAASVGVRAGHLAPSVRVP